MSIQTVGIIGYGHFGQFLPKIITTCAPALKIKVYSSRKAPDGETFFSLEEVCQTDAVILTVPIHVFEEMLLRIVPLLAPHTIIVDVSTVKEYPERLLKTHAAGKPYLSTHPMFGPESYAKQGEKLTGLRIAVTGYSIAPETYNELIAFLRTCGFEVLTISATEHDRYLAESLFLTHFLGQTLMRAQIKRTPIDTLSFGFLMDAVESVKNDSKLFQDVFRFNRFCEAVLERIDVAEKETHLLLEKLRDSRPPTSESPHDIVEA